MIIDIDLKDSLVHDKWFKDKKFLKTIRQAHDNLHSLDRSSGTGWVELASNTTSQEIEEMENLANKLSSSSKSIVIVGIGGAINSAKVGYDFLKDFIDLKSRPEVIFINNPLDANEINNTLLKLEDQDWSVVAISKSGETMETLAAFSIFEAALKKKYKKSGEYKNHIVIITDYEKGFLRQLASEQGYDTLVFPRTIKGRYSPLSAVGLFPLILGGIDVNKVLEGAKKAYNDYFVLDLKANPAYIYGTARYLLQTKQNKSVEIISSFNNKINNLYTFIEQLFMESEGKNGKGAFVKGVTYPNALHSLEQYVIDGKPCVFETRLNVIEKKGDTTLPNLVDINPIKGLEGVKFSEIKDVLLAAVTKAHTKNNVPIININIEDISPQSFGALMQFFMTAISVSCYLHQIDPYTENGVNDYKSETKNILKI